MKKEIWVIAANSSVAKIYRADGVKKFTEVTVLEHPDSRLQSHELVSDQPGRSFESVGTARHAMEPPTSPQKQEFINFAKELANFIDHARASGKISHFYLAANPSFLGLLRSNLTSATLNILSEEVAKDVVNQGPEEIGGYFNLSFIKE